MSPRGGGISITALNKLLPENTNKKSISKHASVLLFLREHMCFHVQVGVQSLGYMFLHIHLCIVLTRLGQQAEDKEMLEGKMYSRFVLVLNEKKAKIRGLQEAVRHLQPTEDQQADGEGTHRSADWFRMAFIILSCSGLTG